MAISRESEVVSFDAEAACEAARETVSGTLRAFVEFDADAFNPMHVDGETADLYDDAEHMLTHFEELHAYVHLDTLEIELFTRLFADAERVEYVTTAFDYFQMVRVYWGEEGLFLALDPDEPVGPIVAAVRGALGGG